MTEKFPRSLTEEERSALEYLLSVEFGGAKKLRQQLATVKVIGRWSPGQPSLDLRVPESSVEAPVTDGPIPVRALVLGEAQEPLGELLVWVRGGRLSALEYAWVTSEAPEQLPSRQQIRLASVTW
jgi:hypothetical protein